MECTFPRRLWNKSENRKVKVKSNNLFHPKDACINNIPGRKSNHAKCKSTWCSWTQRMSEIKQNLKLIGFLWPRSALFNQCGRWDGKLLEKRWVWSQPGGVDEVDDQRGDGKNKDQADLKKDMINCAKSETHWFWYLARMEAIISSGEGVLIIAQRWQSNIAEITNKRKSFKRRWEGLHHIVQYTSDIVIGPKIERQSSQILQPL